EAYARGKKEKPSFLPEESSSSSSSSSDPVPEELLCPLCKDLMTDAAVIPCCGNSYCDKCIRTTLLQSEEQTCPMCHQTDISPDALVANKFLRQAVNHFRNGTGYTKRLCKQIQQQPPPPPPLLAVPPPAAPVTAAELAKFYSLSISSLLEEKTTSITKSPGPPRTVNIQNWSKSPYSASCYSRSSHTYSTSRSGSSHTRSYARSFHRSHAHSYSQLPPYTGRDKGKKCNCCARSRSHGSHHSRSRSPLYRRYQVWSRSPVLRGQSPRKQTTPQGKGQREYFHRYRKVLPCDMKTFYGRSLDLRDPFEKERNREWERNCRQWCDKFHKGCAVGAQPPGNRESRDYATSVRDEPTESNVIAFKALSEKEKKQKDKPKAKIGEKKRQVEAVDPPRTEKLRKPTKASQEKVDTDHERSPQMEPPAKKVKEE
ncbi:PREDICTED: E3 ubiquitin-protein ligase RBBP6-like, partial [Chlamydotis macqueenii]|uniref:E3 ubiquitin-protein ligase RBBP6-like n=1 Tax=Chlamydotis macqueenii TaxID=187382 RepID=UPI000529DC8B